MSPKLEISNLRVCCYCGIWVPVNAADAGSAVKCSCGRRVEVPLLEEFRERADLISSMTVEDRIHRLIAEQELPITGRCAKCGALGSNPIVRARLECERATISRDGGFGFIYIPFLFWMLWRDEERIEVRGHDTTVPAPICLCPACHAGLAEKSKGALFGFAFCALFLTLGGLLGIVNIPAGVVVALGGIPFAVLGVFFGRYLGFRTRQQGYKEVLRTIPVYRQILTTYPDAVVIIPTS